MSVIPVKPIVIFSDASFRKEAEMAAFGLVFVDIPVEFDVADEVIDRYRIETEDEFSHAPSKIAVSGVVKGVDPTSAEIMALAAAFELLRFLPHRLRVAAYCDNLAAVKWLNGSQEDLHEPFRRYSKLIKHVQEIASFHDFRVVKIEGHVGLPDNETADLIAKRRLARTVSL